MNSFLFKCLRRTNVTLYKKIKKVQLAAQQQQASGVTGYHSLSPIKDANVHTYIQALDWALANAEQKDIYNIALTGPYGSGKSSILKTFKEKNENKKLVFLNISLATFKEEAEIQKPGAQNNKQLKLQTDTKIPENDQNGEKETASFNASPSQEDVLRLIELSILQQIFYHEEDEKIPDSRFKKIKTFDRRSLYYITGFLIMAFFFGSDLFYPSVVEKFLHLKPSSFTVNYLPWISFVIFGIVSAVVLYHSVRLLYSLRISKFKIQEAEIEIDKNISKSILNNHLDEILYFFEVTPYSVVLIEDLDRFRQAEIFTKLRELNQLINNSKKIKNKKVVFIYAVRDEMFQNKDRTKFFDFIIPVIPVINSSNSKEKLSAINSEQRYGISPEIIDDISLFIDDMRLLYNVTNEFKIYSALLDKGLPRDNLFAMLVYKNIYPEDFVALGNNEGKLYALFEKKSIYIKNHLAQIDVQLSEAIESLQKLKMATLRNGDELRSLYISKFIDGIDGFNHFSFAGKKTNIWEASSVEGFEYFKRGNFPFYTVNKHDNGWYSQRSNTASFQFRNLEKEVDNERTFDLRLQQVNEVTAGTIEQLKKDIQRLEKQKSEIRHVKLKEIFSDKESEDGIDTETAQGQLLLVLLRSGYIAEDYLDYISLFYEGSLSKIDRAFFINVKNRTETAHDTELVKIENLVKKIRPLDFSEKYLLNYSLLDFLLLHTAYEEQLGHLLRQLTDKNSYGPSFIDGFMDKGTNKGVFIGRLVQQWPDLWKYIDERSNYTVKRKDEYLKYLLIYAKDNDLLTAANRSKLRNTIAIRRDFIQFVDDSARTLHIIEKLGIQFSDVGFEDAPIELISSIISGNHYTLNETMLRRVMKSDPTFDLPLYEESNFSAVISSGSPAIISYITEHLDLYITNVYLTLPGNTREPEKALIDLLNSAGISIENRRAIIERSETKIAVLDKVNSVELDEYIFEYQKVDVKWTNVIEYFNRHEGIDEVLTRYLNVDSVAELLAKEKINVSKPHIDLDTTENFMHHLICEGRLSTENFRKLAHAVPYDYDMSEISGISHDQMRILVDATQIKPNALNFLELKASFPDLHLNYLEIHKADVMAALDDHKLDGDDVAFILTSTVFTVEEKVFVLQNVNEDTISHSPSSLNEISKLMFTHHPFPVSKQIMIAVLNLFAPIERRIQLFNMYYQAFEDTDAQDIFANFPAPVNKVGLKHTTFVLEKKRETEFFANNLQEIGMIANHKPDKKGIKFINFKWKE